MNEYNIQSCQWMAGDRFRHLTNVDYVKIIYFLGPTLFGTPNENFAFETQCKADTGTKKPFS